ncbi:MAG: hypothetical protein ACTSP3_03715 [Candidatus Heimdallarchaeaceae archaeon]
MVTPKEEAVKLYEILFEELGTAGITRGPVPYVDAKYGILEMKEKGLPSWRENEWQGFHLKHLLRELCKEHKLDIQPYTERKNYLVKGEYIWDIRNKSSDKEIPTIWFSNEVLEKILNEYEGIGLLVADSVANKDEEGDLRRWHDELKGAETDYTRQRKAEGRLPREMKKDYMIKRLYAFYFTRDDIEEGFHEGWLRGDFQKYMRQANGRDRGGKTTIDCINVPEKCLLFIANFNEDRADFKEEFGDPEWFEP